MANPDIGLNKVNKELIRSTARDILYHQNNMSNEELVKCLIREIVDEINKNKPHTEKPIFQKDVSMNTKDSNNQETQFSTFGRKNFQRVLKYFRKTQLNLLKSSHALFICQRTFTPDQYEKLIDELGRCYCTTKSHIDALIKASNHELDVRLLFSGVNQSKIITLSKADQKRLISNEEIDLALPDGTVIKKAWKHMTIEERDQLLGKKGGQILKPDQQDPINTLS